MSVSFGREVASTVLRFFSTLITVVFILALITIWYKEELVSDGICNIAILPLEGVIMPYDGMFPYTSVVTPASVRSQIKKIEGDEKIKGILFEVDSPGGTPVASLKINEIISSTKLPNISLIGDTGASGAYLASIASNKIFASTMSSVGSIGVTMSYVENSKKNEEKGFTFVPLSSGEFKDAGNPNKPLTEAEREKFEEELKQIHSEFVGEVAKSRNLPVEKVEELANGSTLIGKKALEAGLVDGIGGRKEVSLEFSKMLNIAEDEVVFCENDKLLPVF